MESESKDGRGISSFSSSSHRMPTISAAQALKDLNSSSPRYISTELPHLDALLQNSDVTLSASDLIGGVSRRTVTEIYGPPGVGKTTLGMQLAASALKAGDGVIWVDAAHPLCGPRLLQVLTATQPAHLPCLTSSSAAEPPSPMDLLNNLTHYSIPTLAHLIALISTSINNHPPVNTSLMVIDSLSTLITNAFPRTIDAPSVPKKPGAPNPSSRKFPVLQFIIHTFQKLAATRNIAIVILSQCVSKMRPGSGAVLVPAINTTAWEQGLGARIALFRDWSWNDEEGRCVGDVRLAQVMKANGVTVPEGRRALAAFTIREYGVSSLPLPDVSALVPHYQPTQQATSHNCRSLAPVSQELAGQKRKFSETELEIPDSDGEDDEDYGWAEEDEEDVPAMPPQWQGSEDMLVPGEGELESEEREEEQEKERAWERDKDGLVDVDGGDGEGRQGREVVEDSEDELA